MKKILAKRFWGPLRVWQLVLLLSAVSAGFIWWYLQPKQVEVAYDPCRIEYGEVVGEWSGDGEDEWNRQGTHYQVRKFSLIARAPNVFFPNAIEDEPTRISTGGDDACLVDFSEEIDTADTTYRWQGARTYRVRLGAPDLGDLNQEGSYFQAKDNVYGNTSLATPVYDGPTQPAAGWVDDGGSATIVAQNERSRLWCVNDYDCDAIVDQTQEGQKQRGSGYLYVDDNCPEGVDCNDEWYDEDALSSLAVEGERLLPQFSLRLNAVSTYASMVGSEMLMVFAYPADTEVEIEASAEGTQFDPGDSFELEVELERFGPSIEEASIEINDSDQPASYAAGQMDLSEEQLSQLNQEDALTLRLPISISGSATTGGCHNLSVVVGTNGVGGEVESQSGWRYCINTPVTTYTYSIETRGDVSSSLSQFADLTAQTLSDSRGWSRAAVDFARVESGGDFTLWLAEPSQLPSFSPGCSAEYSCRVGRNVIINDARWQNATDPWNQAGGSLRDYRHMVINHEVGHLLGHGHQDCTGSGDPAPVMQQQSIDLQGCRFNPWPLQFEIESV